MNHLQAMWRQLQKLQHDPANRARYVAYLKRLAAYRAGKRYIDLRSPA